MLSKEEAAKWLKSIRGRYFPNPNDDFDVKRSEAIDMGIAALTEEPKAEWIAVPEKKIIICSVCHTWFYDDRKEFMRTCPYCGRTVTNGATYERRKEESEANAF